MEEILKKINELDAFLTEENLAKMTPEERTKYLESVERISAKYKTLVEFYKGGIV